MDVIKLSAQALQPIADEGIRVQQGWYDKNLHTLHVTLWLIQDYEESHSDDECDVEAAMVQVNIWSDRDQNELKERIKKLMKKNGFQYAEGNDESEPDTGVFTNAMRFLKLRETEEEEQDGSTGTEGCEK